MRPIRLDVLSAEQVRHLDELHHATRDVRVRTRAQVILLAAEQGLVAAEIAAIARQAEVTGLRMSAPSVCRLLREGGMALNRPQHAITSPDPEHALQKGRSRQPAAA